MTYQVLARKWRPRTFADVAGQAHVVRALANALDSGRLHHAYLFTGTRGVGKTTLARILAKALNCETGVSSSPCGQCASCRAIDAGNFLDLLEVDAATNTRVEEMRELLDNAQYRPTAGRFKVYIIDEVHMLSRSAFNSMLKTLEEPPEHIKFILATTDPQKVPVTVLSRCLQFTLKPLPREVISRRLAQVLEAESIAFEPPALDALARAAQGSLRDSLSLADQAIAHGNGMVRADSVAAMLGAVDRTYLFALLERLEAGDGPGLMAEGERIAERGIPAEAALQELAVLLHRIALAQTVPDVLDEADADRARVAALAKDLAPDLVQLLYQIAIHGRRDLALAPDEHSGFTMTLLRMLAFGFAERDDAAPRQTPRALPKPSPGAQVSSAPTAAPGAAPEVQSAPAPVRAETSADAASFDGDWPALVASLRNAGMGGMLARHAELVHREGRRFELLLPEEHRSYADQSYVAKLRDELVARFGAGVQINVSVGAAQGSSPARLEERRQAARQAEAVAAIQADPFVRDLVQEMDARVIESSIRPVG